MYREPAGPAEPAHLADVRDALAEVAAHRRWIKVSYEEGRGIWVRSRLRLGSLSAPLWGLGAFVAFAALAAMQRKWVGTAFMAVGAVPFVLWAWHRILLGVGQRFAFVRGRGLTLWRPTGLRLRPRQSDIDITRVIDGVDDKALYATMEVAYGRTRVLNAAGERELDSSRVLDVWLICWADIDDHDRRILELIAPSRDAARSAASALDRLFAAAIPTFAEDVLERRLAELDRAHADDRVARCYARGAWLARWRRWHAAEPELEEAVALAPGNALAWNQLGIVRLNRTVPDVADAIACFERARTVDPSLPSVHRNLALALRRIGRQAEALAALGEAATRALATGDQQRAQKIQAERTEWESSFGSASGVR